MTKEWEKGKVTRVLGKVTGEEQKYRKERRRKCGKVDVVKSERRRESKTAKKKNGMVW